MDCRLFRRGLQVILPILILTAFAGSAAAQGGITGVVTNSTTGTPVAGVTVGVFTSTGAFVRSNQTNVEGVYTVTGLASGMYVARTQNGLGFVDQVFNNNSTVIACVLNFCNVTAGAPITVTAPNTTAGISFSLVPGGTITGTVTNATTHAVIPDVPVRVDTVVTTPTSTFTQFGPTVLTNASGVYTVTGLPTGTYFAQTLTPGSFNLVDQAYNNITCQKGICDITLTTPIPVTAPGTTGGINFALAAGGTITGLVGDATTGLPLAGVTVQILTVNGTGASGVTTSLPTSATGAFTVRGLATGTYFARTTNAGQLLPQGYTDQLYNGFGCAGGSCTVTDGTAIAVTAPGTTANINFPLNPGGSISGNVSAAGAPAPGVVVQVFASTGSFAGQATADNLGNYSIGGLPTGSYSAQAFGFGFNTGFIGGILVTAPAATIGQNFVLTCPVGSVCTPGPGGAITGLVTSLATGLGIPGASISVFLNSNGSFVASGTTDANGNYIVTGLANGSYNVSVFAFGYVGQTIFNRTVTAPAVTVVNFVLTIGGAISGTVTNRLTGAPVAGITVSVTFGNIFGGDFRATTGITGTFLVLGLPTNNNPGYVARTINNLGFADQIYPSFIPVSAPGTTGGVNFALDVSRIITVAGNFPYGLGAALAPGSLDILAFGRVHIGSRVTAGFTITNTGAGALTVSGVSYPAGFSGDFASGIIPTGGSQIVHVTFAPAAAKSYSGNITILANQTSGNNTITVAGNAKPTEADFDGNKKADLTVFRPTTGEWFVLTSASGYSYSSFLDLPWGLTGDVPLSGDFDGDGIADLTVYRPSTGFWYTRYSSTGYSFTGYGASQWGLPGDMPLVGDFDGDGKDDLVVYRPTTGEWFIKYSSNNFTWTSYQWGLPGDVPLVADFDGDGIADLTVFRPSTGEWFVRMSHSGYSYSNFLDLGWGLPGDTPLSADFDGDGITDLAVYRPSSGTWYIRYSSQGYAFRAYDAATCATPSGLPSCAQWGLTGDVPIISDLDGDGIADLVVYRPTTGNWFVRFSSSGYGYANWTAYQWGLAGDIPIGEAQPVPGQ